LASASGAFRIVSDTLVTNRAIKYLPQQVRRLQSCDWLDVTPQVIAAALIGQFIAVNAEKYNKVLIARGTPAARRWLPQALALPTFFRNFCRTKNAVRCIVSHWRIIVT